MNKTISLLTISVYILLTGCSTQMLTSQLEISEPISILNSKNGQAINLVDFISEIKDADIIYLAEQHDNTEHHFWQKEVIKRLSNYNSNTSIGFEVIPYTESSSLLGLPFSSPHYVDATESELENLIRTKLKWKDERFQQSWDWYGQIISQGFKLEQNMFGIDLPRSLRSRITKGGVSALTSIEKSLLRPTGFEDNRYQEVMFDKFRKVHCGWGDEEYLSNLYDNWVSRNDVMANTIYKMAVEQEGPVVVIVGAGHTEYNMGVFERVNKIAPNLVQVNIGFMGLNKEDLALAKQGKANGLKSDIPDYPQRYQWLWLTNRPPEGEDPCKAFIQHKKAKQANTKSAS